MNEIQVPQPVQAAAAPSPSRPADPVRRWTLIILVLCVLLFGWTLIADRLTPYTSDARVRTFVVRIAPEVSGKVIEVAVHDYQIVRTGNLLFQIDPTPFRPGARAEVVLDVLPGRVLPARVESIGWGVGGGDVDPTTGQPKTRQGSGGWFAPAQRFPLLFFLGFAMRKRAAGRPSLPATMLLNATAVFRSGWSQSRSRAMASIW